MSKIIAEAAIRGAHKYFNQAEGSLNKAIQSYGESQKLEFPNTAYWLPLIYALTGLKVRDLKDAKQVLKIAKRLLPHHLRQRTWLPYLGSVLDAGIVTLISQEIIEALKYLKGNPYQGIWLGFTDDATLRMQGIKLVDGRMPGFAAIVGCAPTNEDAVRLARELQEKNILVFMASSSKGKSFAEQLAEEGIEMSWDTFLVPYGKDTSSAVFALNFATRAAMTFGGITPRGIEEARKILLYNLERVYAFVLALGEDKDVPEAQVISDEKYATAAGAINFGFPVISNLNIPQILPTGICKFEHVVSNIPLENIVNKAIEIRGLKLKITKIPIPVPYGAGFEGERVRKSQMWVELGGREALSLELLRMRSMDEVEDGKIEVIGPDLDRLESKTVLPFAFVVEVAGRKMQRDFENVLERHIHHFLSCANGVMHTGQRTMLWHRISREAYERGLRLKHLGKIVEVKLKDEFSAIVDKVQVLIVTDEEKVKQLMKEAEPIFKERDERIMGMRDEEVDTYYSCTLCIPEGENVILADGSFTKIEDFIYEDLCQSEVFSLNGGRLEPKRPLEMMINPAPRKVIKLTFNNGNTLRITGNHKILTEGKTSFEWKEARLLKENDIVFSVDYSSNLEKSVYSKYIIDYLDDSLLISDERFLIFLKDKLISNFKSLSRASEELGINKNRLYNGLYFPPHKDFSHNRLKLGEIRKICIQLGIWGEAKQMIREFSRPKSKKRQLKKIKIDSDLFYLAGLVASDGYIYKRKTGGLIVRFVNTEISLIEKFKNIIYDLTGYQPKIYQYQPSSREGKGFSIQGKKRIYIATANHILIGIILKGLGIYREGIKWDLISISRFPSNFVISFLKGLFDGDGHVTKAHIAISCRTERQAQELYLIFKKVGINSYISKTKRGYQVSTRNVEEAIKFKNLIGSNHPAKLKKLNNLISKSDKFHVKRTELLPFFIADLLKEVIKEEEIEITKLPVDYKNIKAWLKHHHHPGRQSMSKIISYLEQNGYHNPKIDEIKRWINLNLQFLRIKKIEKVNYPKQRVFNFSVPKNHNYLINSIILKNCQSYAPNHVCIVSPERLGLCGAYTWIDCKASYEMNPKGANQPVKKGNLIDSERGEWEEINRFVYEKSNRAVERVHHYSIMSYPETSCCIGDTNLIINGEMFTFKEFFDMFWGTDKYRDKKCLTLNDDYKNAEDKIIALQKFKAPKELIRIRTKTGLELIVTADHRIPIDTPDGICWLKAEDLKRGNRVFTFKKIDLSMRIPQIYDLLPDDFRIRGKGLIKLAKFFVKERYRTIKEGSEKLNISFHPRKGSLSFKEIRKLIKNGLSKDKLYSRIEEIGTNANFYKLDKQIISKQLFYLLGLIASDGSLIRRGRYEYKICFTNTQIELIDVFCSIYHRLFPTGKIWVQKKNQLRVPKIKGREIKSQKICYQIEINNFILGFLAEWFGLGVDKHNHTFRRLFALPEDFIASFIAGVFDGDGSIRVRKYKEKWDYCEIYIPVNGKNVALNLSLLLRRLGIVSYIKKSNDLYKLYIYSDSAYRFSSLILSRHPVKKKKLTAIKIKGEDRINLTKSQQNLLPYFVGKELANLNENNYLPETTCFYYSRFKSHPILANALKIDRQFLSPMANKFISADIMLDIIKKVERISNTGYDYVYNLTLSDIHSYFANGFWIANCGCFECIVGVVPEANGVMIVNREYQGETPLGMTFTTLAGSVGGGNQTPGFLGIGKLFITSKKFIKADGGIKRIVWMPKQLKEEIKERFQKRAQEEGVPDLLDKIADEETAKDLEGLLQYLEKVRHPVLTMSAIL